MPQLQDIGSAPQTVRELQAQLGAALRRERVRQRLEQQDLAARAGVARAAVSRVENGHGGNIGTVLAMVRALGCEEWLASLAPQAAVSPTDLGRRTRQTPTRVRRSKTEIGND